MFDFGAVVLVPFPFTDLTSAKVRPALVLSKKERDVKDIVVAFITSKEIEKGLVIKDSDSIFSESGLKVTSTILFDKIATLSKSVVLGEIGKIPPPYLQKKKDIFLRNFGFFDIKLEK